MSCRVIHVAAHTTMVLLVCLNWSPGLQAGEPERVWPTLHRDYQRSGWTPEIIRGPFERKWYRDFHEEMIATRVEAIVAEGSCFVGTFAGHMYALDVADGRTKWRFTAAGPIGASPCYEAGRLYFGADEGFATGHLYCVDCADGSLVWKYNAGAGIWVAPACDGENICFGDRAGVFHAVDAPTGKKKWTFSTGGMILKPASFPPEGGRIAFGSEDMHLYCLSPDGRLLWKSRKLEGLSLRDQGPTIWRGLALVRTNPADSFHTVLDRNGELLEQIQRTIPLDGEDEVLLDKWGDFVLRPRPHRRQAEQDGVVKHLRENPHDQCFYAFDLRDGSEPWIAPVLYTAGLHNPPTPPTFNPDTGEIYTFCRSAMTYWLRGVRRYNALGRMDRQTGRFDLYWPSTDEGWHAFPMIGDETQSLSMMGGILVGNHQGILAGLDLGSLRAFDIQPTRDTYGGIFGPGAVEGGFERAERLAMEEYLVGMPNEWHGPDKSICAIAGGRMFWVTGSQVVCIGGLDVPAGPGAGTKPPQLKKSNLPWCVAGGNVASRGAGMYDESLDPVGLSAAQLRRYLDAPAPRDDDSESGRVLRGKLDAAILELVKGWPWAPLVVELGISGEERHFWRSAETMQIVSGALPYLDPMTRERAVALLDELWDRGMPLSEPVHSDQGSRRESYNLGPGMKAYAAEAIRYDAGIEDLYAVWSYAHHGDRWDRVLDKVDAVGESFRALDKGQFRFDHHGTRDEAERLNEQIAGVLAAARIFKRAGRQSEMEQALTLFAEMATHRVHHERADTWLIRPTRTASKGLHQAKVPRYVGLTPELGAMLRQHAGEPLERNVRALMRGLPVWYQAWGERMIGGENYISPPHLARGVFMALADGCGASPEELAAKLDQPWCKADLYYIEKLTAILRRMGSGARDELAQR